MEGEGLVLDMCSGKTSQRMLPFQQTEKRIIDLKQSIGLAEGRYDREDKRGRNPEKGG